MSNKFVFKNFVLNDNEQIIKVVRQTNWQLIANLIPAIVLIIVPFFFLFILFSWDTIGISIFFIAIAAGCLWLVRSFVVWYFKVLVITTHRIVDIDQQKLFHRIVSDIPLPKVQDAFYRIKGIIQTLSRVGDIQIVLTDDKTKIEVKNIFQPQKIQQLILQLKTSRTQEEFDSTKLSAQDLVKLVKKIKDGLGEEKFKKIVDEKPSGDDD